MILRPTLALTVRQRSLIDGTAASLSPRQRDAFFHYLKSHLFGRPNDAAVAAVVNSALDHTTVDFRGVA